MEGDKEVFEILDSDDKMIVPENVDVNGFNSDASDLGSDGTYNFEDDDGEIEEEEAAPLTTDWMDPNIQSFVAYEGKIPIQVTHQTKVKYVEVIIGFPNYYPIP